MDQARGDFIDNTWVRPTGPGVIRSVNPATDGEAVAEAHVDPGHAALAVAAARRAAPAWAALSVDERLAALRRLARELGPRSESLARAITREMGKPIRESRAEAQSLIDRIDQVAEHQLPQIRPWSPPGVDGECRYHPLGVIGVIGPFNFPLHLVHAHVVPALVTGNTVVIKPSERAPLAAQSYVEAFEAAGLPPVVQLIQGGADVGRALVAAVGLDGLAFTGSWRVGHAIQRALVERPEVLAALEMGGQNAAIVLADADLDQALEGVLLGAYLSAGQRCTRTSRVLVERRIADAFLARLTAGARELTFGDPLGDAFMGPMASLADRARLDALCAAGVAAGAEAILPGERRAAGAWRGPSLHRVAADHDSDYTREEVFGPDLAVTVVDDLEQAIDVVGRSPYGLSVSVFTARRAALEKVYRDTRVGCVNWNRSTNRASGAMPFGGVGRSGNFRPAGSDAVRYTTYPVQLQWAGPGVLEGDPHVRAAIHRSDPVLALEIVHRIEEACEPYGVFPAVAPNDSVRVLLAQLDRGVDLARPLLDALRERKVDADLGERELRVRLPSGVAGARWLAGELADALHAVRHLHPARFLGRRPPVARDPAALPRSEALTRRLLGTLDGEAAPTLCVLDAGHSHGSWRVSVDDAPRVAAVPAGGGPHLDPPATLAALWTGRFGALAVDDGGAAAGAVEAERLAAIVRRKAGAHAWVGFVPTLDEANDLALSLCTAQHAGRRAIVAFIGARHGDTLLARRATWPPAADAALISGDDATRWVALPGGASDDTEPEGWLDLWRDRAEPGARSVPAARDDLGREIAALAEVERALGDDRAACVIAPLRGAVGEPAPSLRWLRALRVLTSAWGVPLVLDAGVASEAPIPEIARELPTPPDALTFALDHELGVIVSRWPLPELREVQTATLVRCVLAAASPAIAGDVGPRPTANAEADDNGDGAWPEAPPQVPSGYRVVRVGAAGWATLRAPYAALLRATGESCALPADHLDVLLADPDAICLAVIQGSELPPRGKLVGACLATPLEHVSDLAGPDRDPSLGGRNTLYIADLRVADEHRHRGLAGALEHALVAAAMTARRPDGGPRYEFVTHANAAGAAPRAAIWGRRYCGAVQPNSPNTSLHSDEYDTNPGDYYRIAICPPRLPRGAAIPSPSERTFGSLGPRASTDWVDLAPGLARRLGDVRDGGDGTLELMAAHRAGHLTSTLVNALSPARDVTPGMIRATELLRALAPKGLTRLTLAPSRSALVDATLRRLGATRPEAVAVLSCGPVSAGNGTAAARAIGARDGAGLRWPTVADPTLDPDRALTELRRELTQRGGAALFAVILEPVYRATGRPVPDRFWRPLRALCDEHGVPLALLEDTTAGFRSGLGMWRADSVPIQADAVLWAPSPGLGLAYLREDTGGDAGALPPGDCDGLALTRLARELRAARTLPITERARALAHALAPIGEVRGEGLYLTVATPHAGVIARRLGERGVHVDAASDDLLRVAPALNVTHDAIERLAAALREISP